MARRTLTISMETEAVLDAIEALGGVVERLARRHGDRFRALDRRIEAFLAEPDAPVVHEVAGEDRLLLMLAAPPTLAAILRDARAMGL